MTGHPTANTTVEIILPSGIFATIRRPSMGELMACMSQSADTVQIMLALACGTVQLDGEYLSADQWLNVPAEDCMTVIFKLGDLTWGKKTT
jgi:hypothetical protein